VVRLESKVSQVRNAKTPTKSSSSKAAPAKLATVKSPKGGKVTSITSRAVVATKVSVAERLTSSHLVKKAEVIQLKSEAKTVTLVAKAGGKAKPASKMPATKISRSEPSNLGSKVITGKFSVESAPSAPIVAAKVGVDKVASVATPISNSITFKSGDKIVYPGHGVGEIEGIRTTVLGGQEHHIYNIKILDSGMKVMVPVSQASAVGLRKIVDKKAIDEVFSILRDRDFKIDTQTWNRRFREYSQKIKTGSVFEIAIVLRDLLVLSADKELSFGEKKMLDMAESLLVSEIAIAKARPHDKVVGELRALFA
jgi:CarD family transcriptional regulator